MSEVRERILAACGDCFLKQGFEKTSLKQLTDAARCSRREIYEVFGGKGDLFEAFLVSELDSLKLRIRTISLGKDGGGLAEIKEVGADMLSELISRRTIALMRLVLGESNKFPKFGRLFYSSGPQEISKLFGESLEVFISSSKGLRLKPALTTLELFTLLKANLLTQALLEPGRILSRATLLAHVSSNFDRFIEVYD